MSTVLQAITSRVSDTRTRLAMTLGALLEGGTLGASGFGVGDNGTSFGPFQIHLPAHPGVSAAQAKDPAFAVDYMAPAYQGAVDKIPAGLWNTDPEKAAEQAAYLAERPAQDYYAARGASTVNADYAKAKAALAGQGAALPATGVGPSSSSSAGGTATVTNASLLSDLNPITWFEKLNPLSLFGRLGSDAEKALVTFGLTSLFVLVGGGLVVLGLYRSSEPARAKIAADAAPLAAAAAV